MDTAILLFGKGGLTASVDGIRLVAGGPSFTAWALPGVVVPGT